MNDLLSLQSHHDLADSKRFESPRFGETRSAILFLPGKDFSVCCPRRFPFARVGKQAEMDALLDSDVAGMERQENNTAAAVNCQHNFGIRQ